MRAARAGAMDLRRLGCYQRRHASMHGTSPKHAEDVLPPRWRWQGRSPPASRAGSPRATPICRCRGCSARSSPSWRCRSRARRSGSFPGAGRPERVVVGASTGLQFTATVVAKLVTLLPLIIAAAFLSTIVGAIGGLHLHAAHRRRPRHGVLRHRARRRGRDHERRAAIWRAARAHHGGADDASRAHRGVCAVPGDLLRRRRRAEPAARRAGRAVAAGARAAGGVRRSSRRCFRARARPMPG